MSSLDDIPLPSNREYLLKPRSLATLVQVIYLNQLDQTRILLTFIEEHLNNHYFFYNLKNTGMIEALLLLLSTPNQSQALRILERFQEVAFDYNQGGSLKLGSFISNDLKMIQDDKDKQSRYSKLNDSKKVSLLSESILLRFLPVPLIKYFYENG